MIISVQQLAVLLLIVGRILGVFIQAPLFNSRSIPFLAKTALAVWIAIIIWMVTPVSPFFATNFFVFLTALVFEVALGFVIGFICNLIFVAIQSAGEIIDLQMGLSVASALDPVFGAVISIVGRLSFFTALIIFLAVNGHHLVLSGFHQSFISLPAGQMANFASGNFVQQTIDLGSLLWLTAIKLSAPIVLLIFISDFTFGIVSRVAPQVNVFMLGFQVKPMLGLFGLMVCMPFIVRYIDKLIEIMAQQLVVLSQVLK